MAAITVPLSTLPLPNPFQLAQHELHGMRASSSPDFAELPRRYRANPAPQSSLWPLVDDPPRLALTALDTTRIANRNFGRDADIAFDMMRKLGCRRSPHLN